MPPLRKSQPIRSNYDIEVSPESTWLHPFTDTEKRLKSWCMTMLGYPLVTVELTDEQFAVAISSGLELYTKYCYRPDKYLMMNLHKYEPKVGLDLSEFNVSEVKDIAFQRDNAFLMNGDLFWGPYAFLGQGGGYPFFNSNGTNFTGSWVTWHAVNEFFDLTKRMTGSNPTWTYDKNTKHLVLMPEPRCHQGMDTILLTVQVEPSLEELYGEPYVKKIILCYCKIILGNVRKKFAGTQLIGGVQIDADIGQEGKDELNTIIENIIKDESCGQVSYIL